jgi:hypothetical protein
MLKHGSPEEIRDMFHRMRDETRGLLKEVVSLVYFMRGSIQYTDMMLMTPAERELISEFIKERLDQERDKMHPVY